MLRDDALHAHRFATDPDYRRQWEEIQQETADYDRAGLDRPAPLQGTVFALYYHDRVIKLMLLSCRPQLAQVVAMVVGGGTAASR